MSILQEFKISFIKPQHYKALRGESTLKIIRFQILITFIAVFYLSLLQVLIGLITGQAPLYINYYKSMGILILSLTILYMWLGVLTASIVLAFIYYVINKFKNVDYLSFKDLFNYASHSLIVCIVFAPFIKQFVILFSIGYYLMALRYEEVVI